MSSPVAILRAPLTSVRRQLGEAIFARVAGPEGPEHRDRIHFTDGPRWFEADSPIALVHGDASMFIGGIRALLLQTLHPAAMKAVADHSGYRGDMWGRLHRTSRYLAVTTFGTAADAQQAVDVVSSIHRRVTGEMPDGTTYAAFDPHLLRWVHLAEVDSFLRAYTVYGRNELDQDARDTYVRQVGEVALRLGASEVPATEAELAEMLAAYRPELRGTPEAREAMRYLLLTPPLPLPARAPYAVLVAAAVGLMPSWTRRHLRLPWLPISERTVVRVLGSAATGTIRWAMTPPPRADAEPDDRL